MLGLFPNIRPGRVHELQVDEIHALYIEESGNLEGLPIVFLHGGPGIGTDPEQRRFFDPNHYRIVLFDQRGCGQSKPYGEIQGNTTWELINDLEKIRAYLGIERWILFGGSWGATLALLYAQAFPERVLAMILRGVFLCRPGDLAWFCSPGGASRFFPDAWEQFLSPLSDHEKEHPLNSFYKKLVGEDEIARMAAAKAWSEWEACCSTLQPNPSLLQRFLNPHLALNLARIGAHYFINGGFLQPNQILDQAHRLKNIPGTIVHGRYDVSCPLENAYSLNRAWPDSELIIIRDAGHSAWERGTVRALVNITNHFARQFA